MDVFQNQAYGGVSETTFQERNNTYMVVVDENEMIPAKNNHHHPSGVAVSNAQGDNDNHDDDNEYVDMMSNRQTETSNRNEMLIQANSCYSSNAVLIVENYDTSVGNSTQSATVHDTNNEVRHDYDFTMQKSNSQTTMASDTIQPSEQEDSLTYEDLSHIQPEYYEIPRSSPQPQPPSYEELAVDQHQFTSAQRLQQSPNNAGSIRVTSNVAPPFVHQQSTTIMQGLPQLQMQTHTPGIPVVQPATVYYDPDRVRESTRKSNEGLCGRCWCFYSVPFCAVYSVIILIVCFFIVGGPFTLFWSIPSAVLLIVGAKTRKRSFIAIGLGIQICFGIWSFVVLMPAWGGGLYGIFVNNLSTSIA